MRRSSRCRAQQRWRVHSQGVPATTEPRRVRSGPLWITLAPSRHREVAPLSSTGPLGRSTLSSSAASLSSYKRWAAAVAITTASSRAY